MTPAQLLRSGGQISVVGAGLIVVSQLVGPFLPADPVTLPATTTSVPFLVFTLSKLVGSVFLMLGLVSLYLRESAATRVLGFLGFLTAFVGTALVTGDWWFEAFVVPWLAQAAPDVVASPVAGTLLLGGVSGYATCSIGWLIFGVATFRAHVFPRWMAVLLMAGAVVAIGQGFPPLGAPLAIAVGVLGLASLHLDLVQPAPPSRGSGPFHRQPADSPAPQVTLPDRS